MPLWSRMEWLRREGIAGDLLEAMDVLKAAGEWPSEEEMGMAGRRVLSPERGRESMEGRATSPRREMRPPSSEAVGTVPPSSLERAMSRGGSGRRDRLSHYY